jgi:hypothetical protein
MDPFSSGKAGEVVQKDGEELLPRSQRYRTYQYDLLYVETA